MNVHGVKRGSVKRGSVKRGSVKRGSVKRGSVVVCPPAAASTLQPFNASTLLIANRQRTRKINLRLLKQMVSALLAELKIEDGELGIHLVGAREMARVNRQFLHHEGSTDVITFDQADYAGDDVRSLKKKKSEPPHVGSYNDKSEPPHVVSYNIIRGELFICVDDAVKQAKEFQTTWQSEIVRYVVHGILHLLGHDDLKPELRRKMKRAENRLVQKLEKGFSLAELSRAANMEA